LGTVNFNFNFNSKEIHNLNLIIIEM